MSNVKQLNKFYGRFFKKAVVTPLSPYRSCALLGQLITPGHMPDDPVWERQIERNRWFVAITLTVIPVLPAITAITLGLSLLAAAIMALSMLLTYPISAVLDIAIPENKRRNQYAV